MKLSEVYKKGMTNYQLLNICDERAKLLEGKVTKVVNLGNHEYRTVRGFFDFENRTLRIDKKTHEFLMHNEPFDINTLPKEEGTFYLVSKICAAFSERDDFVFVINDRRAHGGRHYLYTL